MNLVKVRFLKYGIPSGREYTYETTVPLLVGDVVELPHARPTMEIIPRSQGVVTKINIPEAEIETFKDRVKAIVGKVEKEVKEEATNE